MLCLGAAWANAQSGLPTAKPNAVGMSSERLARIGPALQAPPQLRESGTQKIPKNHQKLAYPSNPILNTPSIAILNSWVEWLRRLLKLERLLVSNQICREAGEDRGSLGREGLH